MTTMQIFTEDKVLIASPDWCKWRLAMLRSSQRRSMKQEQGRLRATAEREETDGAHSEGVYGIVPMQDTDEMYRHLAQTNLRVLHGRVAQTSLQKNSLWIQ